MEEIFIDMREQGTTLSNCFQYKDFVSVEEVLTRLEELIDDIEHLQEEFDDYKEYVRDNYKELSQAELIGYSESDYI